MNPVIKPTRREVLNSVIGMSRRKFYEQYATLHKEAEAKRKVYWETLNEMSALISKIGSKKHAKAIKQLQTVCDKYGLKFTLSVDMERIQTQGQNKVKIDGEHLFHVNVYGDAIKEKITAKDGLAVIEDKLLKIEAEIDELQKEAKSAQRIAEKLTAHDVLLNLVSNLPEEAAPHLDALAQMVLRAQKNAKEASGKK